MTDHIIRTTITVVLQGCAGTFDKTILKELETDLNTAMAEDPYDVGGLPEGFTATSSSTSAKVEFDPEDVAADLLDALSTLLGDTEDSDYLSHSEQVQKARAAIAKARGAA